MRTDRLANALEAMGCPDALSTARLTLEVLDCLEDPVPDPRPLGARLVESRGERYGHPSEQWARAAMLFSGVLNGKLREPIEPHEVGLLMLAWKLSRLCTTPDDPDSLADLAGYAAALEVFHGRTPTV